MAGPETICDRDEAEKLIDSGVDAKNKRTAVTEQT